MIILQTQHLIILRIYIHHLDEIGSGTTLFKKTWSLVPVNIWRVCSLVFDFVVPFHGLIDLLSFLSDQNLLVLSQVLIFQVVDTDFTINLNFQLPNSFSFDFCLWQEIVTTASRYSLPLFFHLWLTQDLLLNCFGFIRIISSP